ncbi:MAG: pyrrolysine--tRNA(Pyl) ligase large subunit [Spirochaetes bacterium]|nr:pyrrolysine--tRNA(Pyl) ligase large subunit [Spirochaetota bacterium]
MHVHWTPTQKQRLIELNAPITFQKRTFSDTGERNTIFLSVEKKLVKENKKRLHTVETRSRRPTICDLENKLTDALIEHSFVQVVTPVIISRASLRKMSIDEGHNLFKQVFWIDKNRCLRPMLAPNLYVLLQKLSRLWKKPIRIFETGPCFRKDTNGKYHMQEFTMLNLVELGLPMQAQDERLKQLTDLIMNTAGITNYRLARNRCEVYGDTVDVVAEKLEVASGVTGPHTLDSNWGIRDPWVGIGFGIERLALVTGGYRNIGRVGRSVSYLDGIRLNI